MSICVIPGGAQVAKRSRFDEHSAEERWSLDSGWLAEETSRIRVMGRRAIQDAIGVGECLSICRLHLEHGDWLKWLDNEFGWSGRAARNFIYLFELSISEKFSDLKFSDLGMPLSAFYELAQPRTPPEVQDKIIERAKAGEQLKVSEVKRAIQAAKPSTPSKARPRTEAQRQADKAAMRDNVAAMEEVHAKKHFAAEAEQPNARAKTELKTSIEADDPALSGFTTAVAELLRLTRKQQVGRFAETAVGASDLAHVGKFLNDLATLLDPGPTPPPTNANGGDVKTEPSVEPPVPASVAHEGDALSAPTPDLAARVAELVATFPSDGGIPPFLLRTPPKPPSDPEPTLGPEPSSDTVSPAAGHAEQAPVDPAPSVPRDAPAPAPTPAPPRSTPPSSPPPPAPSTTPRLIERTKVLPHYLPAHRGPWPANWKKLDADELEEAVRATQAFGVNHRLEDRHHRQLDRMRARLNVLRAADRAERPQTGAEARL
jgi:Protein of unknown function (DUF3102)